MFPSDTMRTTVILLFIAGFVALSASSEVFSDDNSSEEADGKTAVDLFRDELETLCSELESTSSEEKEEEVATSSGKFLGKKKGAGNFSSDFDGASKKEELLRKFLGKKVGSGSGDASNGSDFLKKYLEGKAASYAGHEEEVDDDKVSLEIFCAKIFAKDEDVSVHDQVEAVIKEAAFRLNAMGYLLVKMGAALKVGGRRLKDLDGTLSIVFGPAKFRKQKASLWALDIAKLGNCTAEVRLTQMTAKIINAYAARSKPSSIYKGVDQIGEIVGSTGDSLEDVALRLAGHKESGTAAVLPKPEMTESGEALLENIMDVIVKHGAH
ncbi:hypothetical protein HPB49_011757 [Dermacentor silvarum]|uniref:Uncharacterized protein n=1 Tax=Dermacentor silvarum TaxID=543639 RepID=A0ACB8DCX4_DERSI|nr:hypothetical protein HPB49_011757 [Dermacentor silvarum]